MITVDSDSAVNEEVEYWLEEDDDTENISNIYEEESSVEESSDEDNVQTADISKDVTFTPSRYGRS